MFEQGSQTGSTRPAPQAPRPLTPAGETPWSSSQAPKTAVPPTPPPQAQVVHTMPGKFVASPKRGGGSHKGLLFLIIGLGLVLIAGGVALFLRFQSQSAANTNLVANVNTNTANANAANTNTANTNTVNTNEVLPTVVTGALTDPSTNEEVGTASLSIPTGALPASVKTVAMTTLSPKLGAYATSQRYQAVGGVYIISPSQTKLTKAATLVMTYTDQELLDLDFTVNDSALVAAYWSGSEWKELESTADSKANTVTTDIREFYSDGIAIVAKKPESTNTNTSANTNTNTTPPLVPSMDSDADGLTNQEEILFGTNSGNKDTDLDGYLDGQEVLSLFNPNGTGKLVDSTLVKKYENTTYRFSIYHPPSWTVGTLNADKLVTFTSITGEFVQVSVQENPAALSAREWYTALNPSVNQSDLQDVVVGTLMGIIGPDDLNVYLADATYIYQITYNVGIKTEVNYLTTFTMMYKTFLTTPAAQSGNSNSNTNSSSNQNSNSAS